jgi:hypothetical protein
MLKVFDKSLKLTQEIGKMNEMIKKLYCFDGAVFHYNGAPGTLGLVELTIQPNGSGYISGYWYPDCPDDGLLTQQTMIESFATLHELEQILDKAENMQYN